MNDETRRENLDEFFKRVERDEAEDQRLITPVAYGRLRGIAPQQVYYWIRRKKLEMEMCDCGRKCVSLNAADDYLRQLGKLPPVSGTEDSRVREGQPTSDLHLDRDGQAPEESRARSDE